MLVPIYILSLFSVLLFNQPEKMKADLMVFNAQIYTVSDETKFAQALVVANGKIIFTGTTEEANAKYESARRYDAGGKSIFPGFNDAHCHFYGYGMQLNRVNLLGTKIRQNFGDLI